MAKITIKKKLLKKIKTVKQIMTWKIRLRLRMKRRKRSRRRMKKIKNQSPQNLHLIQMLNFHRRTSRRSKL